jgi:hypothetical protein
MKRLGILVLALAAAAFGLIDGARVWNTDYAGVEDLRHDYFRTGALGGEGECAWVVGECEMLVDGTTPVVFAFGPPAGDRWVVELVLIGYTCNGAATPPEWGNTGNPLTNGIVFRLERGGETTGLADITTNAEIAKIGRAYDYWWWWGGVDITVMHSWEPSFPLILDGNRGDEIQIVINDDLTVVGAGTTLWAQAHAFVVEPCASRLDP